MKYDSAPFTKEHIEKVRGFLNQIVAELEHRAEIHDASKLVEPEKSVYDEYTPKIKSLTYMSEEYKECLKKMGVGLRHHYENNPHHPEHYENGINGMSLLDVIEMLADWKAATLRHADGDINKSLEINRERQGLSEQLYSILANTIRELGW